ncbi:MAG: metallophosphoesterase [Candidatus Promineifilaceae bacterium]|nr:metallophosphoesterase [Candidatus Promineifilaceae bacterium]
MIKRRDRVIHPTSRSAAIETVYFVHFSDTHIGPSPGFSSHGRLALPYAQRLIDVVNGLPSKPDFVMHTGDIVNDPHPESYALAAEVLSKFHAPIYYVNGNHDRRNDIRKYLEMGPMEWLGENPDDFTYVFELKGFRFLVIDARGPLTIDPQGQLSESQLAIVRREAAPDGPPLVIFIHYPVLAMNSPWMDTNMLITNGEELHQALLPARQRLRAVFHGHVHQPMQIIRDGIVYVAAASSLAQFAAWPVDETIRHDLQAPAGFNFVHLLPQQTIIHQHTFQRP